MCLALPGRITEIKEDTAVVDFKGIRKEVNVSLVDVKVNDWVLVHVGFAIQKIDKLLAQQAYKLLS